MTYLLSLVGIIPFYLMTSWIYNQTKLERSLRKTVKDFNNEEDSLTFVLLVISLIKGRNRLENHLKLEGLIKLNRRVFSDSVRSRLKGISSTFSIEML